MVLPFALPAWADTNWRNLPPLPLLLRVKICTFYNLLQYPHLQFFCNMCRHDFKTSMDRLRADLHTVSPGTGRPSTASRILHEELAKRVLHVGGSRQVSQTTRAARISWKSLHETKAEADGAHVWQGKEPSLTTVWEHMLPSRWPSWTIVCKWDGNTVLRSAFQKTAFLFCIKSQNLTFLVWTENVKDP